MKELAVIIPVYNGGPGLLASVLSCARAAMSGHSYGIFVIDNCSTDGSVDRLPATDHNHVPITIYRNDENLGRTGNWNRALEIAEQEGFQFASFLFAGDTWVDGASIGDLLDLMRQNGAVLGMAPLLIGSADGGKFREGSRISFDGERALVDSDELLQNIVRVGRLPFAPLQANIYRLFADNPLRFNTDPRNALNTDIESTVVYLKEHPGKIAFISRPFLIWKENPERFFAKQDPWSVMLETRASLARISEATGFPVDWASANAVSFLTSAYDLSRRLRPRARLAFLWRVFRFLRRAAGSINVGRFVAFMMNKLLRNRSYLCLPRHCAAIPAPHPSVSRVTL